MKRIFSAHGVAAFFAVIVSVFAVVATVQAATTISTDIQTGGMLSVTGTSTMLGITQIGTTTASLDGAALFVSGNFPVDIQSNYANGISMYTNNDAQFRAPYINFFKSRGSYAGPTAIQYTGYELNSIGGINFGGWDGTQYYTGASIFTQTDENWSSTHHGAHISIYGTNIGSGTNRQIAQFGGLDSNGYGDGGILGAAGNNIIIFGGLAWGGNQSGNPAIFTSSNPAVVSIRNAANTADGAFTAGKLTTSGLVGAGTSTPIANFQVANGSNATTTMEVGSAGQNKGSCLKLYRTDGTPIYAYIAAGATTFTLTTTSCANVSNF